MQFVQHYDKRRYVYMRDSIEDHMLFAVEKKEHEIFSDMLLLYHFEAEEIPDDYTIEVHPMREVAEDIFSLEDDHVVRYPMNHLLYAYAFPANNEAQS